MRENEIRKIIDDAVSATILGLQTSGILRDKTTTAAEKTEELLRQYNALQATDQPYARTIVDKIDTCFAALRTDPYIAVIRLYYIDGMTNTAVAREMYCSERTVRRNRKKLVREFAARLMADDFTREITQEAAV